MNIKELIYPYRAPTVLNARYVIVSKSYNYNKRCCLLYVSEKYFYVLLESKNKILENKIRRLYKKTTTLYGLY